MALFAVVAVLFNPVLPIYMYRQSWLPVDLVAAARRRIRWACTRQYRRQTAKNTVLPG